jgi:hypothetical protein
MTQVTILIATQVRVIHLHKKIKYKILKRNANVQLKQEFLKCDLTPNYVNIKVKDTSPGSKFTQHKIGKMG